MMVRGGADVVDLWAMAAELERQFAGYKQRLAGTSSGDVGAPDAVAAAADDDARGGGGGRSNGGGETEAEAEAGDGGGSDVRGRMYEAYTRRRDERLRSGWRARMQRKEAEVMALWAQLDRGGRAGSGGAPGGSTAGDCTAGEDAEDDGEKRRSSDVAAPGTIPGKKHVRTRSFSSSNLKSSSSVDVGRRRALSQEPPPSTEPSADAGKVDSHRARPTTGVRTAAPKRKALPGSKGSAKEQCSVKPAGPKPPRYLPRRCSSGVLEGLGEAVALLPNTFVVAPVQTSCSSEHAAADHDEAPTASSPRPSVGSGSGTGAGIENARAASPDSDRGEVVDGAAADGGEAEVKNVVDAAERRVAEEEITVSPETRLGNGEITTSDSETEPSYVYVKKDVVGEETTRLSEDLAGDHEGKNGVGGAGEATRAPTADADVAAESTTTNAEEAPARESCDESSFSGRSGRGSPSCSSRDQSIVRQLEADAELLQKKREEGAAEKSAPVSTPGSAGSRVSGGTPRTSSPRETPRGFKKRFLSFGKKNKGREATVIDCTSPSVPSPVDDGCASGRWQTTESDDTGHGAASPQACSLQSLVAASPAKSELSEIIPLEKSPKAHRSFFSLRSFNCGRS